MVKKFLQSDKKRSQIGVRDDRMDELSLAKELREIAQVSLLSADEKSVQRNFILNTIKGRVELLSREDQQLKENLAQFGQKVALSSGQRSWLRGKILERIAIPKFQWVNLWRGLKSVTASVLLVMIVFSSIVILPIDYRMTKASKWTYLDKVSGEVYINRDGQILAVNSSVSLIEGDIIITRQNSSATIRFMDDSVARLGNQTSLQIEAMAAREMSGDANTQINLLLAGGKVWAHVVNLIGRDSHFSIETENATALATTKASFEVISGPALTKVAVYENTVDLSSKLDPVATPQTLVKGYSGEINNFQLNLTNSVVPKVTLAKVDQDQWVEENQALDREHNQKLLAESQDFVDDALNTDQGVSGVLADVKDLTMPYFKTAEVENARKGFWQVHMDFLKAQQLLNETVSGRSRRTESLKYIFAYRGFMKGLMEQKADLESKNKAEADELFKMVNEHIDQQSKALALVLPGESLFIAKNSIADVSEILSGSAEQLLEKKLLTLRQVLYDTEGLIDKRNFKLAQVTFEGYLAGMDDILNLLSDKADLAAVEKLYDLLGEQVKQLKILNSLEIKLTETGEDFFVGVVIGVEKSSLNKMLNVIETYRQKKISYGMLMELYSLVSTYGESHQEKAEAINELEKLLANYDEFKQLKKDELAKAAQLKEMNIDQANLEASDSDLKPVVLDFGALAIEEVQPEAVQPEVATAPETSSETAGEISSETSSVTSGDNPSPVTSDPVAN